MPLSKEWKEDFETAYMDLGGRGERVLGECAALIDDQNRAAQLSDIC